MKREGDSLHTMVIEDVEIYFLPSEVWDYASMLFFINLEWHLCQQQWLFYTLWKINRGRAKKKKEGRKEQKMEGKEEFWPVLWYNVEPPRIVIFQLLEEILQTQALLTILSLHEEKISKINYLGITKTFSHWSFNSYDLFYDSEFLILLRYAQYMLFRLEYG